VSFILSILSVFFLKAGADTFGLIGDVDLDGKITVKDVTFLQKYLVKYVDLCEISYKSADVFCNGKVDVKCAMAIQKYIAKFDMKMCEQYIGEIFSLAPLTSVSTVHSDYLAKSTEVITEPRNASETLTEEAKTNSVTSTESITEPSSYSLTEKEETVPLTKAETNPVTSTESVMESSSYSVTEKEETVPLTEAETTPATSTENVTEPSSYSITEKEEIVPETTVKKIESFPIKLVQFRISGGIAGQVKVCIIDFEKKKLWKTERMKDEVVRDLDDDKIEVFFAEAERWGFTNWSGHYAYSGIIYDGYQWNMEIVFSDGKVNQISGRDACPDTWLQMRKAFEELTGESILSA